MPKKTPRPSLSPSRSPSPTERVLRSQTSSPARQVLQKELQGAIAQAEKTVPEHVEAFDSMGQQAKSAVRNVVRNADRMPSWIAKVAAVVGGAVAIAAGVSFVAKLFNKEVAPEPAETKATEAQSVAEQAEAKAIAEQAETKAAEAKAAEAKAIAEQAETKAAEAKAAAEQAEAKAKAEETKSAAEQAGQEVAAEQSSADLAHDYMIHFLATTKSMAFERSNPVTKADDLKDLGTKMVCDHVKVSSVKEMCDSREDHCFLGALYKPFFDEAAKLEKQFLSGAFECVADDHAGSV